MTPFWRVENLAELVLCTFRKVNHPVSRLHKILLACGSAQRPGFGDCIRLRRSLERHKQLAEEPSQVGPVPLEGHRLHKDEKVEKQEDPWNAALDM